MGYVMVASDRQQAEFPENSVVRFRGWIPAGLDLRRGDWEVWLTSLFLPGQVNTVTPPSDVRTMFGHTNVCVYGDQYRPKEPMGSYTCTPISPKIYIPDKSKG